MAPSMRCAASRPLVSTSSEITGPAGGWLQCGCPTEVGQVGQVGQAENRCAAVDCPYYPTYPTYLGNREKRGEEGRGGVCGGS